MVRHKIPIAKYATFTIETLNEGLAFLQTMKPPYVLKADGLAAGKGVLILKELKTFDQKMIYLFLNIRLQAQL